MPNVNVRLKQKEFNRKNKLPDDITWPMVIRRGLTYYEGREKRKNRNSNETLQR